MASRTKPKKEETVPRWLVITGAALALVASLGAAVNYGGVLYRVPFAQEALDKRVTKVESAVEAITQRLSRIESDQRSVMESQDAIKSGLMELTAMTRAMNETTLTTWKKGMELEEKLKNFQIYTDERIGSLSDMHKQPKE